MKTKRMVVTALVGTLVVGIAALLVNTRLFLSKQKVLSYLESPPLRESAIANLQSAIRYRTVSHLDSAQLDSSQFLGMHRFLEQSYPLIHSRLQREIVSKYSLLYTWKGKDPGKKALIFMAHMDVVPVEDETLPAWESDPFQGVVSNQWIHGRGAADNKMNLISIMEAIERLLRDGFEPERTIYFVLGHDEEAGGHNGAEKIAALLKSRNVKAALLIDEGGFVTTTKFPDIATPVALVGTSEKGYMNLKLTVQLEGGHSSMPEEETAISVMSESMSQLHHYKFPISFEPSTRDFIQCVGPAMPFKKKFIFANSFLFKKVIAKSLTETPVGNAMIRTVATPTVLTAGLKENVIPSQATAVVNVRILPGEAAEDVIKQIRNVIDPRIEITPMELPGPSAFTSTESDGYKLVEKTIRNRFGNVLVTPFLLIGGTDSRYFNHVADDIVRFTPMYEPHGFHGINERISLESFRLAIAFYTQIVSDSNAMSDTRSIHK